MKLLLTGKISYRLLLTAALFVVSAVMIAAPKSIPQAFDTLHLLAYAEAVILIAVFVLLFYNIIYHYREQNTSSEIVSQNQRLALVLQTGNLHLWIYDLHNRHYIMLSSTGEYSNEYNPIEFAYFFDRDDFELLRQAIFDICEGKRLSSVVTIKSALQEDGSYNSYEFNISIAHRDNKGKIEQLLCIQHDITNERRRKDSVNQLLMRYHTVFNSSLSDMIYYDSNGILRDINEKAMSTFNVPDRNMALKGNIRLQDNPIFNAIDFTNLENTRTTYIANFKDFQNLRYRPELFGQEGKMYYESTINPIRDEQGRLEGIYMAGRNVTEMVESFHHQQAGFLELRRATKSIQDYISNINYALQVSDVRLVNYYPSSFTLEISNNVNKRQLRMSQLRCIRLGTPRFRRAISSALNRMDHLTTYPFEQIIETEIRDKKGRQIWQMFHMVPMLDENGRVERYFGMCRNMTEMVETERRLAIETKKAQETELLKQSFLTNMSYEIRTPLNTVIGFAELFETDHDEADEPLFVEEIKRNSNSLLRLVNDILYLSRLDANMIEYKKEYIDFALIFDAHCQIGWSGISPNVKTIVENPYEHLIINIDQEHLGHIIEKLCMQASAFTEKGTVRAKCEYRHGELTISIEDTGKGLDEETLSHIFDRFARNTQEELCGTGLDLPIVQALVEQMGGNVEMQSELNKGTTAWITIPCEAKTIEKRVNLDL